MFGRWLKNERPAQTLSAGGVLQDAVQRELPQADAETVAVVTAMVGLLGAVAYADRNYSADEEARVRSELSRVHGITEAGVTAICHVLRQYVVELSTLEMPRFARALVELADRELRLDVLRALLDLAAADGSISLAETNMLRQLTTALGLSQQDYVELQSPHRHLLDVNR